jgi:CcmD family protein
MTDNGRGTARTAILNGFPVFASLRLATNVLLMMACLTVVPALAQTQPPPSPAQEGFVPIDQLQPKEQLPAAPLVMAAYSVAWLVIFGYVWSIWRRLSVVEREIASVSQRVSGGGRR